MRSLIPSLVVSLWHFFLAWLGAALQGFPSKKLIVIGVTGTTGKSTVVWLLSRMLEASGAKVAATSSIEFKILNRYAQNKEKMTMPGRMFLQKFLKSAVRAGCTHAVIEVTSEGIAQSRHRFIDFDIAVLTNLRREHIERHGSEDAYKRAKGKLFAALSNAAHKGVAKTAVINLADENAGYFLSFKAEQYMGYRFAEDYPRAQLPEGKSRAFVAENLSINSQESSFDLQGTLIITRLKGRFNAENVLAASSAAFALGVTPRIISDVAARTTVIPGRMEEILDARSRKFSAFVDYAHTPDALEAVYRAVHTMKREGAANRLICVLGAAGGGRDKWKRPEMGQLAARYCDHIIVTNEDPYDEDPRSIIDAIVEGARTYLREAASQQALEEIVDRKKAIFRAVHTAQPGDVVLVTGKGAEPWMAVEGGKKIPWDDREIVRQALLER